MNRKLALIGTGITVGTFLLITSAYAGITESSGYETYKSSVKNTFSAESMTNKVAVSVQDNGKQVLSVNATVKNDKTAQAVSANVNVQGGDSGQALSIYTAPDGRKVFKSAASEVYTVIDKDGMHKGRERMNKGQDEGFHQEAEKLIDALAGHLKQFITETDTGNGSKEIRLSLSGDQIPAAANAIGAFVVKKASNESIKTQKEHDGAQNPFGSDFSELKAAMPKLTQDVAITNVDLLAAVDENNTITKQQATLTVSGKDEYGEEHKITLSIDLGISGVNSTIPDSIDLTGKQVQIFEPEQWKQSKFNH